MTASDAFCAHLVAGTALPNDLEDRLACVFGEAALRYKDVSLSLEAFAGHLGRHFDTDDVAGYLDHVRGDEMFLAAACARGDPAAIRAFETEFLDEGGRVGRRLRLDEAELDELTQRLRHELFVHTSTKGPSIENFAGRGPLRAWLRIVAVRCGQRIFREHRREVPSANVDDLRRTGAPSPERDHAKRRYQTAIAEAVRAAVTELSPHDRDLLHMYFAEGITPREIGARLDVHRTTVGRWIENIQGELLSSAKRRLMEQLNVDKNELEDVLEWVQTRFDVTLSGIFSAKE